MTLENSIPEIYVLWHPSCALGEVLARRIHGWLRPGSGLGPQVFYRSLAAPEAPAGGLPPPLPGEIRPARIEAQWINCCRIVRITQKHAGIAEADTVTDAEAKSASDRARFNAAIVLSAMRRLAMEGMAIDIPDVPTQESVPPIEARVILGGKVQGFSGFLPGLFEEALVTLERQVPLYVLGGFGGAAEVLAEALLGPVGERPREFTLDWQKAENPNVEKLLKLSADYALPTGTRTTAQGLDALYQAIDEARPNLGAGLNTGLDEVETRELLTTRDMVGRSIWC